MASFPTSSHAALYWGLSPTTRMSPSSTGPCASSSLKEPTRASDWRGETRGGPDAPVWAKAYPGIHSQGFPSTFLRRDLRRTPRSCTESVPPPNIYPREAGVWGRGDLWSEPHGCPVARTETQTLPLKAEVASVCIKPAMRAED